MCPRHVHTDPLIFSHVFLTFLIHLFRTQSLVSVTLHFFFFSFYLYCYDTLFLYYNKLNVHVAYLPTIHTLTSPSDNWIGSEFFIVNRFAWRRRYVLRRGIMLELVTSFAVYAIH